MVKNLQVYKFGGASVKNPEAVRNVANILAKQKGQPVLVVVSAMGKITNKLEEVARAHAAQNGKVSEKLNVVKKFHYDFCKELFGESHPVYDELNDIFVTIEWVIEDEPEEYDYTYDQIVSCGELLSTKIVSAYLKEQNLQNQWLDARDVIRTDELYRDAWVLWDETVAAARQYAFPPLEEGKFVITQGFIGSTADNNTTTLGREGSDYTAAIFSFCLDAESMSIWKDVPGVLTADPRIFENVTKLDRLSYREAIEMTYYGAKVIHPKTIKPLQNKNIPLYVKSFVEPEGSGTLITTEVNVNYPPMVAVEKEQALIQVSPRDFSFVAEHHMSFLFQEIAAKRLQVNMMQNTAISFDICVNHIDNRVEEFKKSIEKDYKVDVNHGLELVTIRHHNSKLVKELKDGKIMMMEQRIRDTVQLVMKDVPLMKRKG